MDVSIRVDPMDRVKNMVRHSLVASPGVSNRELFDRAREIAPAVVEGMSLRQFHAKFRLPITRHEMGRRRSEKKKNAASDAQSTNGSSADNTTARNGTKRKPRSRSRSVSAEGSAASIRLRADVRSAIVDFAVALESAEQRSDLVRVMATIDDVVDGIMSLAGRKAAAAAPNGNGSSNGADPS
jgi:hypothetical protein